MIDINDIPSILSAWPIEPIAACERIRNHDVFAIHTTGQRRWVLKYTHGRQVVARLDSDYVLLRYLHDAGVPVAVPLLTRDKHCYATGNEGVFTLHPNLLPVRPLPVCDVQRRNWNPGRVTLPASSRSGGVPRRNQILGDEPASPRIR